MKTSRTARLREQSSPDIHDKAVGCVTLRIGSLVRCGLKHVYGPSVKLIKVYEALSSVSCTSPVSAAGWPVSDRHRASEGPPKPAGPDVGTRSVAEQHPEKRTGGGVSLANCRRLLTFAFVTVSRGSRVQLPQSWLTAVCYLGLLRACFAQPFKSAKPFSTHKNQ